MCSRTFNWKAFASLFGLSTQRWPLSRVAELSPLMPPAGITHERNIAPKWAQPNTDSEIRMHDGKTIFPIPQFHLFFNKNGPGTFKSIDLAIAFILLFVFFVGNIRLFLETCWDVVVFYFSMSFGKKTGKYLGLSLWRCNHFGRNHFGRNNFGRNSGLDLAIPCRNVSFRDHQLGWRPI